VLFGAPFAAEDDALAFGQAGFSAFGAGFLVSTFSVETASAGSSSVDSAFTKDSAVM